MAHRLALSVLLLVLAVGCDAEAGGIPMLAGTVFDGLLGPILGGTGAGTLISTLFGRSLKKGPSRGQPQVDRLQIQLDALLRELDVERHERRALQLHVDRILLPASEEPT